MKCPNCGLINPDEAIFCDCGYNFKKGKLERPITKPITKREEKSKISQVTIFNIIGVIIISIIGIIILSNALLNVMNDEQEVVPDNLLLGVIIITLGNLLWIMLCQKWKLFIEIKTQLKLIHNEFLGKEN